MAFIASSQWMMITRRVRLQNVADDDIAKLPQAIGDKK